MVSQVGPETFAEIVRLYDDTPSLQDRTCGTGVVGSELVTQWAPGGFVGRASGRDFDCRRDLSYPPYAGAVFDVAVDIRKGSPTFGQWVCAELTEDNHRQLWVPAGFAHGFCVTSEEALFHYKCTDGYHPECEMSVRWNDPAIGIDWPIPADAIPELSPKDLVQPLLAEFDSPFAYDGVPMSLREVVL